jgi:general secretion pathway protein K
MRVSSRERGAALVLVLVFTTAMAAAAVAFIAGRHSDALTLRGQLQSVEAEAMLDAALRQTMALLANRRPNQIVPDRLSWMFGSVAVQVQLERERGKVDLNQAPDTMLRALPLALGADEDRATVFADAVQDWRDDNHLKLAHGAEDGDYRGGSGPSSGAADRPFANPAELLYLHGMDRGAWSLLQPYVTVYSGAAQPDARAAPPIIRRAIELARELDRKAPKPDTQRDGNSDATGGSASTRDEGAVGNDGSALARQAESASQSGGLSGSANTDRRAQDEPRSGAASGTGNGAATEEGARTVLLDVKFPNGYEAAAKAVIAQAAGGSEGPPFTVLSWTPVLRARGDVS